MKTSELTGAALDWAVAHCEGRKPSYYKGIVRATAYPDFPDSPPMFGPELNYSTDWAQGGPIIEREKLALWFSEAVHDENGKILRDACWYSETSCTTDNGEEPYKCDTGPTPLIAAMRCYVASKLGDEVGVPDDIH